MEYDSLINGISKDLPFIETAIQSRAYADNKYPGFSGDFRKRINLAFIDAYRLTRQSADSWRRYDGRYDTADLSDPKVMAGVVSWLEAVKYGLDDGRS